MWADLCLAVQAAGLGPKPSLRSGFQAMVSVAPPPTLALCSHASVASKTKRLTAAGESLRRSTCRPVCVLRLFSDVAV